MLLTELGIFLFPPSCGAASFFGDKSILTEIVVLLFILLLFCLNLVPSHHILQRILSPPHTHTKSNVFILIMAVMMHSETMLGTCMMKLLISDF